MNDSDLETKQSLTVRHGPFKDETLNEQKHLDVNEYKDDQPLKELTEGNGSVHSFTKNLTINCNNPYDMSIQKVN